MPDFLRRMTESSKRRVLQARAGVSERELRRRIDDSPAPPELRLHADGFDLIAEVKPRSPSAGGLGGGDVAGRALAYRNGGAAAVSVLTEPDEFGGSLETLARVSAELSENPGSNSLPAPVPTMRKDFLVDPYQVLEARAAGAGGVLVVLRIVDDARLEEILCAAAETGLFVLLEAFDQDDLERAGRSARAGRDLGLRALVGLNARDLVSLTVDPHRLHRLSGSFPPGFPKVAESGLQDPDSITRAAGWGYDLGLVGTALMREADPSTAVSSMIQAGRASSRASRVGAPDMREPVSEPAAPRAPGA